MPKEFGRNRRFAELIKRELASLISAAIPINEYGIITITVVDVSSDLRSANVFITCLDDSSSAIELLLDTLDKRVNFFRAQIARALFAKRVPTIKFKYDKSVAQGMRLFSLLNSSIPAK